MGVFNKAVLEKIDCPADLRGLTYQELEELSSEIREKLINQVLITGGHLASNLGVVELTIAIHRVFNSPKDKILWDVGHQSYVHKLLTGRKDRFNSLRQYGGLSGFTDPKESVHDVFVAGHAGTSISAALGMALARDLSGENYHVLAVIGDGALTAGMAFEALNHAGHLGTRLIVIVNDNGMSISPSVGGISRLLSLVKLHPRYEPTKKWVEKTMVRLPFGKLAWALSREFKKRFERALIPGVFWEELGFTYLGPVDGHNIKELETILTRVRDYTTGPAVIHVLTKKGKGYAPAEVDATKFHGVIPADSNLVSKIPSYSEIFGRTVLRLMRENEKVIAITAAMLDGTGLAIPAQEFPHRVFDVGICEQHAVTLAAGLATQGFIPIVAIYSTFLQRAYDQIIHDVCLQNLPVILAIDRAGIVGDDGKTHQGAFDISYLRSLPNIVIAAPKDENEFQHLLFTATKVNCPIAIRYPRGRGPGVSLDSELKPIPIGKGEILRHGDDVAILAFGSTVYSALVAAEELAMENVKCAVVNARFAKPLDSELILELAARIKRLVTVEENVLAGGFGSVVLELLQNSKITDVKVERIGLPDRFIDHGSQELFRSMFNLDSKGIAQRIRSSFPLLVSRGDKLAF